jgi:hypothetical protein
MLPSPSLRLIERFQAGFFSFKRLSLLEPWKEAFGIGGEWVYIYKLDYNNIELNKLR